MPATAAAPHPPLVVHLLHALKLGGVEVGLVEMLHRFPPASFRHAIVCLTVAGTLAQRLPPGVAVYPLHKRPGQDFPAYFRLWQLLRRLRPAIVHSRTVGTLDAQLYAWLARVPVRLHGEEGVQTDPDLTSPRDRWLRRAMAPLITRYTVVARSLYDHLHRDIGIAPARLTLIPNGVDIRRFHPAPRQPIGPPGFSTPETLIVGAVGRMHPVKDHFTLLDAFARLAHPAARLAIIGDGPLLEPTRRRAHQLNLSSRVWIPGARDDIHQLLGGFDVFVLPSLGEGMSITLLEAMATGLAIVATAVGGTPEVIDDGVDGTLTPRADAAALARALERYLHSPPLRAAHGAAARAKAVARFSLDAMVAAYHDVYSRSLASLHPR